MWAEKFGKDPKAAAPTNFGVQAWCQKCAIAFVPSPPAFVRLLRDKGATMAERGILFIPEKKAEWKVQSRPLYWWWCIRDSFL